MCARAWLLSHVRLFVTLRAVARQAPLSVGFFRQEYWSRLPFPSPGHLPNPGIEPASPALAGRFFTTEPPGKSKCMNLKKKKKKDKGKIAPSAYQALNSRVAVCAEG